MKTATICLMAAMTVCLMLMSLLLLQEMRRDESSPVGGTECPAFGAYEWVDGRLVKEC